MDNSLSFSFFKRDTRVVARELLGMRLVRLGPDGRRMSGLIVETEAYRRDDSASHSYHGETERNAAMFMAPATAYVYLIHGVHCCLNFSTEETGAGAAVLIRALEPTEGIDQIRQNRNQNRKSKKQFAFYDLCSGPARLCQALDIGLSLNKYNTLQAGSCLFVEFGPGFTDCLVSTSPRIGVIGDNSAVNCEWRWFVAGSPFVSHRLFSHPQ